MTDKLHADSTSEVANNSDAGDNNLDPQYLLNSPAYMSSAMRRQLLQEMVKSLPVNVQKRVNALKNIEIERLDLEAKFYEQVNIYYNNMHRHLRFVRKNTSRICCCSEIVR